MSVEPNQSMSATWTRWQGHVVNGTFLLERYIGGSDHSGVFSTKSATYHSSQAVVKLIPTTRAVAQARLPVWKEVSRLTHRHLLGLFECGSCQFDGSPYLYVVMERADQTLAHLLQHRTLTDNETREMLAPTLDALAFLHGQKLVQGQLKPSNILVVGDQLKLASDTIRRVGKITVGTSPLSVYDPPEARHGSATAGDVWALGVSLSEALAHRPPQGLDGSRKAAVLPPDLSPVFGAIVASCLSTSPQNRPSVTDLMAWAGGRAVASPPAATSTPAALVLKSDVREAAPLATARAQLAPETEPLLPVRAQLLKSRVLLTAVLGAIMVLVLGWTGVRALIAHRVPPQGAAAPTVAEVQAPAPPASAPAIPPTALHEAIPDVPQSVLRSIHGHINIGVRVIVEQDGSVFAALADRTSASKYLQRLAIDAAKEWTFPPVDTPIRRLMQIRFDFGRDGTTASARALD
jgi:hypothetical protein